MAWIAAQPWSNTKVYQVGASAGLYFVFFNEQLFYYLYSDGIISYLDVMQQQPTLHGQWLIWSSGKSYDIAFGGGALKYNLVNELISLSMVAITQLFDIVFAKRFIIGYIKFKNGDINYLPILIVCVLIDVIKKFVFFFKKNS
jgi:hypothetical protein